MMHARKPHWVGAFVGSRIAVEKIAHCLVEMSFTVFCGGQEADDLPLRELEGGGMVLMRRGNDRSAAGGSKAC